MRNLVAALLAGLAVAGSAAAAPPPAYGVVDRIAGPDGGWDYVRVDAANNRVLVARGTSVMSVDLDTRAVTGGLAPGLRLHDPLPVNGGQEVLVSNGGSDSVVFFDAKSFTPVATVTTGKNPDAETFDPRSGLVLVMDHTGGTVTLVDPRAHAAVGTIEVGGLLEAAVLDGAGQAFINVEDKNQIAVLDLAARKVTARYALAGCESPTGLAYDAANRQLLAACDGSTVLVDARSGRVLATAPSGKGADGIAFDPARRLAFVSAGGDGWLAVLGVDRARLSLAQKVPTALGAKTLALDSRTGRLYLPSVSYGPPTATGARGPAIPGTFQLLVLAPARP